jgi:NitT/TauT family transport system ATP-binding protein
MDATVKQRRAGNGFATVPEGQVPEPHLTVSGVTRTYAGSVHALGPISVDLNKNEFFAVVGPSGCGKSTFLDVLAGLSPVTGGEIRFEGRRVDGEVPDGIGVVFQEDASFPWLTVAGNIGFGLRRRGMPGAEIARRVERAIDFMGLSAFADAFPSQLSGGMRQRVCIARTLVLEPRLILLDEPFGALDQQTRLLMGDELLRLWRETGATVVLITHAIDEAAMLADRVGIMSARPGRFIDVVETGWPRDRDSRIAADIEFGRVTTRIWNLLREESVKSMANQLGPER